MLFLTAPVAAHDFACFVCMKVVVSALGACTSTQQYHVLPSGTTLRVLASVLSACHPCLTLFTENVSLLAVVGLCRP